MIADPTTWTSPWGGVVPMIRTEGPMFEYACHEESRHPAHPGDHRNLERQAAAAAAAVGVPAGAARSGSGWRSAPSACTSCGSSSGKARSWSSRARSSAPRGRLQWLERSLPWIRILRRSWVLTSGIRFCSSARRCCSSRPPCSPVRCRPGGQYGLTRPRPCGRSDRTAAVTALAHDQRHGHGPAVTSMPLDGLTLKRRFRRFLGSSVEFDQQLRGRSGRQGDPGSSRFFVSVEAPIIARYGIRRLMTVPGLSTSDEPTTSPVRLHATPPAPPSALAGSARTRPPPLGRPQHRTDTSPVARSSVHDHGPSRSSIPLAYRDEAC